MFRLIKDLLFCYKVLKTVRHDREKVYDTMNALAVQECLKCKPRQAYVNPDDAFETGFVQGYNRAIKIKECIKQPIHHQVRPVDDEYFRKFWRIPL